jgi:P4 family phage/plasmid primase-like protien
MSTVTTNGKSGTADKTKPDPVAEAWAKHAGALAAWADKHVINRRDAWGGYYRKDGETKQTTRKALDESPPGSGRLLGSLDLAKLSRHFAGRGTDDVVGAHSTSRDEDGACRCRWGLVDIDAHPGQPCDPDANLRYALALYDQAVGLGFRPLLYDSNGTGGYHLVLLFAEPVPSPTVYSFLLWLIRDWEKYGLKSQPECFPKQREIEEGKFGNWVRLPGRHHTRSHYTRVWDGERWIEAADAIRYIVTTEGSPESLIPDEAAFDLAAEIERKRESLANVVVLGETKPRRQAADDGTIDAGTDFNNRATWESILGPHGWVLDRESKGVGFWRRPGKDSGHSATTNHSGRDTLMVFTTNSPFDVVDGPKRASYTKFGSYTLLNHGGDFTDATRTLSLASYGTFATFVVRDRKWVREIRPNPCPKGVKIAKPGENLPGEDEPLPPDGTTASPPAVNRTDLGNARRLVSRFGAGIRYCHPWRTWFTWDGRRWLKDQTGAVKRMAKKTVQAIAAEAAGIDDDDERKAVLKWALASESRKALDNMQTLAESEPGVSVTPDEWDSDHWLLNCLNGTLDLRTGELRPHRREDLITRVCPVEYDPHAPCPRWERFETEVFAGDAGVIGYMRRAVGYSLTGSDQVQELNILHGDGSNGKNVYLDTVRGILGDYADVAEPSLLLASSSDKHPTGVADLCGRRFVTASETDDGKRFAEGFVKRLTGDRTIKARWLHKDFFTFLRTFKVFLATNSKPEIRGTDLGIWRRIRLVPFKVTFVKKNKPISPPLILHEQEGLTDELMKEAPGILALLVRGCLEWQKDGMTPPPAVVAATEEYRQEMDTVADFIAERCNSFLDHEMLKTQARVSPTALYQAYTEHTRQNGIEPLGARTFGGKLEKLGYRLDKSNGKCWRCGITLRADGEGKKADGEGKKAEGRGKS